MCSTKSRTRGRQHAGNQLAFARDISMSQPYSSTVGKSPHTHTQHQTRCFTCGISMSLRGDTINDDTRGDCRSAYVGWLLRKIALFLLYTSRLRERHIPINQLSEFSQDRSTTLTGVRVPVSCLKILDQRAKRVVR